MNLRKRQNSEVQENSAKKFRLDNSSSNNSFLMLLPCELVLNIFFFLQLKDAAQLAVVNRLALGLFRVCKKTHVAPLLAQATIEGNWEKMEQWVVRSPEAMFSVVDVVDLDGEKKKYSPLQYVLYVYDRFGLEIFARCAAKNHELARKYKDHVDHFLTKQKIYLDLDDFFNSYTRYIEMLDQWLKDDEGVEIADEELVEFWCEKIGGHQKKIPRHLLNLACASWSGCNALLEKKSVWNPQKPLLHCVEAFTRPDSFDIQEVIFQTPIPAHKIRGLLKQDHGYALGKDFAILRGNVSEAYGWNGEFTPDAVEFIKKAVKHDLENFKYILQRRKEQQTSYIEELQNQNDLETKIPSVLSVTTKYMRF